MAAKVVTQKKLNFVGFLKKVAWFGYPMKHIISVVHYQITSKALNVMWLQSVLHKTGELKWDKKQHFLSLSQVIRTAIY